MTAFLYRCWLVLWVCLDWRHWHETTTISTRIADWRERRQPHVCSAVHCSNCGHGYVAVLPASSPCYNARLGIVDMLECSECGLFTVCSD